MAAAAEGRDIARLAGDKLGNYRLQRLVGQGRMGVVYLATDEALLRPTAVKVLSWALSETYGQDPVQWFLAEARLVARINHPRVVQIYAVARHGDARYIAMEYVDGPSTEALVEQHGPMAPAQALEVLIDAAAALQAAHECGVVHRDVKPANLLLGSGGTAKLTDFGMALSLSDDRAGFSGVPAGTPLYTAPEVWLGAPASPASDLYALGATGVWLLTGRPPFRGRDFIEIKQAHLRTPFPDPRQPSPAIDPPLLAVLSRALAKAPEQRYATARALGEALRALRGGALRGPVRAPVPSTPPLPLLRSLDRRSAASPPRTPPDGVPAETARFLSAWWREARSPEAPPLLCTPDAVLLIDRRAGGQRARLERLADNAMELATASGRGIVTSWEAWTAPVEERLTQAGAVAELSRRREPWPPEPVRGEINACRERAGLPPWPEGLSHRGRT